MEVRSYLTCTQYGVPWYRVVNGTQPPRSHWLAFAFILNHGHPWKLWLGHFPALSNFLTSHQTVSLRGQFFAPNIRLVFELNLRRCHRHTRLKTSVRFLNPFRPSMTVKAAITTVTVRLSASAEHLSRGPRVRA